jgi:hypothetical protein
VKLTPPVELVSPPDPAAWDALVAETDDATVFHTSAWARLWIAEWPGARWEAVVLPEGSGYAGGLGLIVRDGAVGRRVMAMPYGTYSGPIVRRGHPDATRVRRQLLEATRSWFATRGSCSPSSPGTRAAAASCRPG